MRGGEREGGREGRRGRERERRESEKEIDRFLGPLNIRIAHVQLHTEACPFVFVSFRPI